MEAYKRRAPDGNSPSGFSHRYCGGGVLELSDGVVVDCESLLVPVAGGQSAAGPPVRFGSHSGLLPGVGEPLLGDGGADVSGVVCGCCVLDESVEVCGCCCVLLLSEDEDDVDDCGSASARRIVPELCVLPVSAVLPVSESERMLWHPMSPAPRSVDASIAIKCRLFMITTSLLVTRKNTATPVPATRLGRRLCVRHLSLFAITLLSRSEDSYA